MSGTVLIRNVHAATMSEPGGFGEIRDAAVVVEHGKIAWIGPASSLSAESGKTWFDGGGAWLLPGLIDCHTHLVYAGNRSDEFERRLAGESYEQIAASGGGILATVAATRAADEDTLVALAQDRLNSLTAEGVTTVEVKSGYGLLPEHELKMLRAAGRLHGARVKRTLLALHALSPEYKGRADAYVEMVRQQLLPAAGGLADAVDVFCESIAFDHGHCRIILGAAKEMGMATKVHADQLSNSGGACLAAFTGSLSGDHLEFADEAGVLAMAKAGTVAVLLPGAFYSLRQSQAPPIELFRRHRVRMAVATDHNPGTSPCLSPLLAANMACTFFGLTPAEAVAGLTRHAATALGIEGDVGTLEVGKQADMALFEVEHPRDLAAQFGVNPCVGRWLGGVLQNPKR